MQHLDVIKEWALNNHRGIMAALAAIAVILVIIGLCFSWFVYNKSLSTVGMLQKPSEIRLKGPNATEMAQIDLSYTDADKKTVDGKEIVTIKRAFCVSTENQNTKYYLELARTTNISGLNIELYSATDVTRSDGAANAEVTGYDGLNDYYAWNSTGSNLMEKGNYINQLKGSMLADPSQDEKTFGQNLDENKLQRNASPVYWRAKNAFDSGENSLDNYIIKLSWEENQKETDVIYLIAQSAGASSTVESQ